MLFTLTSIFIITWLMQNLNSASVSPSNLSVSITMIPFWGLRTIDNRVSLDFFIHIYYYGYCHWG